MPSGAVPVVTDVQGPTSSEGSRASREVVQDHGHVTRFL